LQRSFLGVVSEVDQAEAREVGERPRSLLFGTMLTVLSLSEEPAIIRLITS
jgi:hypothetical protein